MKRDSNKRPAIEPASTLFIDDDTPVQTARPSSIMSGAGLILLRAASSVPWMISLFASRSSIRAEYGLDRVTTDLLVGFGLVFEGTWMLLLLVLCWLVWRGSNIARMLVLFGTTTSIIVAAVGYFVSGEAITVKTTLLTLSLDILTLLALSSRDARTWSRSRRRARRRA